MNCPKCGGPMYDNRETKKSPKQPDYKCKNYKNCDGVIWPEKAAAKNDSAPAVPPIASDFDGMLLKYTECVSEAVGLGQRIAKAGIPVDGSAISSMAATLWISRKEMKV